MYCIVHLMCPYLSFCGCEFPIQSIPFRARICKRLRSPGIDSKEKSSVSLCSLAGRYDNLIPTRFLAPIDLPKIPALYYVLYMSSRILGGWGIGLSYRHTTGYIRWRNRFLGTYSWALLKFKYNVSDLQLSLHRVVVFDLKMATSRSLPTMSCTFSSKLLSRLSTTLLSS